MTDYEIMLQFIQQLARNGIPCDTTPTLGGRLGDGTNAALWYSYLQETDKSVRDSAQRVLDKINGD